MKRKMAPTVAHLASKPRPIAAEDVSRLLQLRSQAEMRLKASQTDPSEIVASRPRS